MDKQENDYYYKKLKDHVGHAVDIVGYSKVEDKSYLYPSSMEEDYDNISIECLDCNEVLLDFDKDYEERN